MTTLSYQNDDGITFKHATFLWTRNECAKVCLLRLSGFANVFELCQHEGGVNVIGRLSQCSHASRSRETKKFCGWQTTVRHPGKGQFVINGWSRVPFVLKHRLWTLFCCSQDCYCVDSGLKWKFNLCQLILIWNCDRGNILSRNIWGKLVALFTSR